MDHFWNRDLFVKTFVQGISDIWILIYDKLGWFPRTNLVMLMYYQIGHTFDAVDSWSRSDWM